MVFDLDLINDLWPHTEDKYVKIHKILHKVGREEDIFTLTLMWPSPWCLTLTLLMTFDHIQRINKLKYVKLSFFLIWPWPWPNDLDTQIWPRYGQDVPAYQNEVSMWRGSKVIVWTDRNTGRQTDRHTHTHTHTHTHRHDQKLYLPHTRVVNINKARNSLNYLPQQLLKACSTKTCILGNISFHIWNSPPLTSKKKSCGTIWLCYRPSFSSLQVSMDFVTIKEIENYRLFRQRFSLS